jgi:hypothetical protein
MPYCPNCGTYNEGSHGMCTGCREPLYDVGQERIPRGDTHFGSHRQGLADEEYFGLPHGRAIVRMFIGSIILIFGVAWVLSLTFNISIDVGKFLPFLVIIFALLIIAGAIYELRYRS